MATARRVLRFPWLLLLVPIGCSGAPPSSGYGTSGLSAATGNAAGTTGSNVASGASGSATAGTGGGATGSPASGAAGTSGSPASGAAGTSGSPAGGAAGAPGGDAAPASSGTLGDATSGTPGDAAAATGDAGTGCPGIAIVPDADGFVAPGSNTVGIHGSWFVYSDCTDLKGVNCAKVSTPTGTGFGNVGGKICTSGMTSDATGAWGAGIGLELSDGPPQQPYDTVASGVKGFCFQLSGASIPTTSIRVAFPTQDNNDNAYFEGVTTPGMHTVLFSDTAQGSWVTSPVAFEPTKVMLMQFQIPSSPTAPIPWDFCVSGVTAITQ
jgi:hypothetical protein